MLKIHLVLKVLDCKINWLKFEVTMVNFYSDLRSNPHSNLRLLSRTLCELQFIAKSYCWMQTAGLVNPAAE